MGITGAELLAIVAVRGADEAAVKLAAVGGAADSAGAKLGTLAAGAIVLTGAALVGVGVASVKMAADFQQGLNRLVTGAGDVTDNMAKMGQSILKVSVDTGVLTNGADGLNAAMYLILSSGQRGAQALDTLSVAAKGAQIEQAKVVDVANVVSGVMTNYGTKTFNATQYMNGLIKAVQQGKITLQDLSVAMGPIDPIAQHLGIHFNDVAAAMTTQTNAMIPAARAATGLRFMMSALENPTKKAKDEMSALGLNSVKVAEEMTVSLPGALQMIVDAAKKVGPEGGVPFNRAVADMVGGIRGLSAFTALTGEHMKDFAKNSAMILATMQQNKNAVIGWDTVQQNFNLQMDRGKAALAALAISIGQQLLPYVTQLLQQIIPLITQFTDWVVQNNVVENSLLAVGAAITNTIAFIQNMITIGSSVVQFFKDNQLAADALGVAIGMLGGVMTLFAASSMANMILSLLDYGLSILTAVAETVTGAAVMTSTFTTMSGMIIASMGAAAASILATLGPFLLAGAVIAAVSIGIVLAIQHWGDIASWLQTAWSNTLNWFSGALQQTVFTINVVIDWFRQWWGVISATGTAILVFFAPALIIAGAQATASGAVITATFIASLARTGAAAIVNAAIITNTFIWSLMATGIEAVANAEILAATFIASMVRTGAAAIVSAAQITYSFIASLILTGAEGWAAAGKLAPFIAAMIATGTQAVIQAAKITFSFIASLAATAAAAYASAYAVTGSFVPALLLMGTQAVAAAGKLLFSLVPALTATGVASWAAIGPIGLLAAAVIGLGVALKWGIDNAEKMNKQVTFNVDDMATKNIATVDRMRLHLNASTDQMVRGVSDSTAKMAADTAQKTAKMAADAAANAHQMDMNVTIAAQSMAAHTLDAFGNIKNQGGQSFNDLLNQVDMDMSTLDANAKQYWADVMGYIENNPIQGHVTYTTAGGGIGVQQSATTGHNAGGTDNWRGGWSWVGERGPELMNIPRGAQIIPHDKSVAASGGAPINLHVDVILDGTRMTGQLMPRIVQQIRQATGVRF